MVNARNSGGGNQPRIYALDPDRNLLESSWGIASIGWIGQPQEHGPSEEIDLERSVSMWSSGNARMQRVRRDGDAHAGPIQLLTVRL